MELYECASGRRKMRKEKREANVRTVLLPSSVPFPFHLLVPLLYKLIYFLNCISKKNHVSKFPSALVVHCQITLPLSRYNIVGAITIREYNKYKDLMIYTVCVPP